MGNKNQAFGTYEIAKICHVTPPTVGRWIKEGKLPFFQTGGGHSRVWLRDLIVFLKAHNIPIPPDLVFEESLKILVVDDDGQIRRTISRIIHKLYPETQIHEAADGFEAGQKAAQVAPALIIVDLRLPGIDGIRMCRLIRQNDPWRQIKILVITGYASEEVRRQALEAGADDFLAKPFETKEFAQKLEALLSAKSAGLGDKT